ncbi:MAG: T4SS-associated protein EirA [Coxiellaceae bacterium]|jgi:hypothetical protein|nr:T4SS-associated protein EirA [Coxiellaceae bacterium]
MRFKYYILGGLVVIISIVVVWVIFFRAPDMSMKKFASNVSTIANVASGASSEDTSLQQEIKFCPKKEDLIKDDTKWVTLDRKWATYTPSSATKIINFIGVQWKGIKVGQVLCLYKTDEAVPFPLALEQTRSQLVLEPKGRGWGPLTGKNNTKFCSSANIFDCPFSIERVKDISNIYEEIKYAPRAPD